MRLDLPHELPRRPERQETPLEPSPMEQIREQLEARARQNLGPNIEQQNEQPRRADHPSKAEQQLPERVTTVELIENPPSIPHDPRIQRNRIPEQAIGVSLREEDVKVLSAVGRFRVISVQDLSKTIYNDRISRLERDLAFLRHIGLVEVDAVQARRDGRRADGRQIEVVTLTQAGKQMARQVTGVPQDQTLYAGLVKYREVEHDSQIYPAYLKEAERIQNSGGTNLRVRLDFELKAQVQKAIYAARKAAPETDLREIKQQVAKNFDLPYVHNRIQIPDARIEYDINPGSESDHQDIEVLTAAYRPGHLRGKAQAGFHLYASPADRATLTAKIENEHNLLGPILEL
jgi:hypothetical protein